MQPNANSLPKQRCTCCSKVLFMGIIRDGVIEIPCRGCGTINTFKAEAKKVIDISQEDRPTVWIKAAR